MRRRRLLSVVFHGGLAVLLAAVLLQITSDVLPGSVAGRIERNSEGYLLALLVGAWIQFARDRVATSGQEWRVAGAAALSCAAIGLALLNTDLPSRFRTLYETFLAAAVLIPYVQLRRPLPQRLATLFAAGMLAVVVVGNRTAFVTELAETLAAIALAPLVFDLVDRGILDPRAPTSWRLRYGWYAGMVAVPIVFTLLEYGVELRGPGGEITRYGVRVAEAFVCMLVIELYFAVGLGRTGRPDRTDAPPRRRLAGSPTS